MPGDCAPPTEPPKCRCPSDGKDRLPEDLLMLARTPETEPPAHWRWCLVLGALTDGRESLPVCPRRSGLRPRAAGEGALRDPPRAQRLRAAKPGRRAGQAGPVAPSLRACRP